MRPSAPWMKNARKSSVDNRSIRRQISRQCCGGWSRGRISQTERQQPDRKEHRRSLIHGTAQRSEAKEEKREKDRRYRHRTYGRAFATAFAKRTSHAACALVHAPAAGRFGDVVLSQCAAARVSLYERQDHHRPQTLRKGTHH